MVRTTRPARIVPAWNRVYATAIDTNEVVAIDETTGTVVHRSPTGDYPDGRACFDEEAASGFQLGGDGFEGV
nr:hypothetical protein OH837_05720 [Streptomyces canus]